MKGETEVLVGLSPLHRTRCAERCARTVHTIFLRRREQNWLRTGYKGHRSPTSTTSSRPHVSARPDCAREALVSWGQEAVKLPQKVRLFSLPPAHPSLTDAPVTIPSLYFTACGSVSLWEPEHQGAGKIERQRSSSRATHFRAYTRPPRGSFFAPTSSAYFGSLRVSFSTSKYSPMTVYALQGSAYDLVPAVHDVGEISTSVLPSACA